MIENYWNSVSEIFDLIFNGADDLSLTNRLYPSYPPTDIYVKEDRTLIFDFAVAGYPEDAINLSYEGDHLILNLKCTKEVEKYTYIKQGIKHSEITVKYAIPIDKYNITNLNAELKNGILKVTIPAKEKVESKKINIKK